MQWGTLGLLAEVDMVLHLEPLARSVGLACSPLFSWYAATDSLQR